MAECNHGPPRRLFCPRRTVGAVKSPMLLDDRHRRCTRLRSKRTTAYCEFKSDRREALLARPAQRRDAPGVAFAPFTIADHGVHDRAKRLFTMSEIRNQVRFSKFPELRGTREWWTGKLLRSLRLDSTRGQFRRSDYRMAIPVDTPGATGHTGGKCSQAVRTLCFGGGGGNRTRAPRLFPNMGKSRKYTLPIH